MTEFPDELSSEMHSCSRRHPCSLLPVLPRPVAALSWAQVVCRQAASLLAAVQEYPPPRSLQHITSLSQKTYISSCLHEQRAVLGGSPWGPHLTPTWPVCIAGGPAYAFYSWHECALKTRSSFLSKAPWKFLWKTGVYWSWKSRDCLCSKEPVAYCDNRALTSLCLGKDT